MEKLRTVRRHRAKIKSVSAAINFRCFFGGVYIIGTRVWIWQGGERCNGFRSRKRRRKIEFLCLFLKKEVLAAPPSIFLLPVTTHRLVVAGGDVDGFRPSSQSIAML